MDTIYIYALIAVGVTAVLVAVAVTAVVIELRQHDK